MVDDNKRNTTAIQVSRETWQLAIELKGSPSTTMDEVVSRALKLYKHYEDNKKALKDKLEQDAINATIGVGQPNEPLS